MGVAVIVTPEPPVPTVIVAVSYLVSSYTDVAVTVITVPSSIVLGITTLPSLNTVTPSTFVVHSTSLLANPVVSTVALSFTLVPDGIVTALGDTVTLSTVASSSINTTLLAPQQVPTVDHLCNQWLK